MKYIALFALMAMSLSSAHKLEKKTAHAADYIDENGEEISTSLAVQLSDRINMSGKHQHACDFVDEKGEEISTSLMPEY